VLIHCYLTIFVHCLFVILLLSGQRICR